MSKHVARMALAGVLIAALVAGCTGSPPRTSYYSLYAPAPRPAPGSVPAGGALVLGVGPVVIPDTLKQIKIATGGTDGRYQLSEYHRWSGEVDRDFARALAEQLAGDLGTEQVAIYPWDQHFTPTCRVLVDVLSMGGELGKEATLTVRWTLLDPRVKVPPLVRRSDLREVPATAGHPAWVAAQQRNIGKLGREIVTELRKLP